MGKHRDRLEIIADILKIAKDGSSKTNIMLRANLSYDLLEKYLGMVLEYDFLEPNKNDYHLTETGRKFLSQYTHLRNEYLKIHGLIDNLNYERKMLEEVFKPKST